MKNQSVSVPLSVVVVDLGVESVVLEGCEGVINIFSSLDKEAVLKAVVHGQKLVVGAGSAQLVLGLNLNFLPVLKKFVSSHQSDSFFDSFFLISVSNGESDEFLHELLIGAQNVSSHLGEVVSHITLH